MSYKKVGPHRKHRGAWPLRGPEQLLVATTSHVHNLRTWRNSCHSTHVALLVNLLRVYYCRRPYRSNGVLGALC